MDNQKIILPSPKFGQEKSKLLSPQFASSKSVSAPKNHNQTLGSNGITMPEKYLQKYKSHIEQYNKKFDEKCNNKNNNRQNFYCQNCDIPFDNKSLLNKHKSEYKNCTIDGCPFKSCPVSITKHIEELHVSGLYDKIKNLNTPEEIAKWREERKKRYPTVANVELRQKVQEERRNRGERLEHSKGRFATKNDRKRIDRGIKNEWKRKSHEAYDQCNKRKNYGKTKRETDQQKFGETQTNLLNKNFKSKSVESKNLNLPLLESVEDDDENFNGSLPKFRGTSNIPDYVRTITEKKVTTNVLTGLLGMYGESSGSDESESDSEIVSNNLLTSHEKNAENNIIENISSIKLNCSAIKSNSEKNEELGNSFGDISETLSIELGKTIDIYTLSGDMINKRNSVDNSLIMNEDDEKIIQSKDDKMKEKSDSVNTSLISMEDDDEDMPEEKPIVRTIENNFLIKSSTSLINSETIHNDHNQRNNGNVVKQNTYHKPQTIRSKIRPIGSLIDYSKLRQTPQNTLLEKLLEPQIRHERNVILQCVRYVVERNFFGIGQDKEKATEIDNNNKSTNVANDNNKTIL